MAFQFGFSNDDDDVVHDAPSAQTTSIPAPASSNASTVPVKALKLEDLVGTIMNHTQEKNINFIFKIST
jgi:hypothetical protein